MATIYKKPNHQILIALVGAFSVFKNTEKIKQFIRSNNNIEVEVSPSDIDEDGVLKSVRFIHKEWILDCNELGLDISIYLRPITDRPGMDYWLSYDIKTEKAYDYDDRGKELIYNFNDQGVLI